MFKIKSFPITSNAYLKPILNLTILNIISVFSTNTKIPDLSNTTLYNGKNINVNMVILVFEKIRIKQ